MTAGAAFIFGFIALVAVIAAAVWGWAALALRDPMMVRRFDALHRLREDARYALAFCGIVAGIAGVLFGLAWAIME